MTAVDRLARAERKVAKLTREVVDLQHVLRHIISETAQARLQEAMRKLERALVVRRAARIAVEGRVP